MQFFSLYTPATPPSGPPSAEHMAAMVKLMDEMSRSGALVTTGGIMSRDTAAKIVRKSGKFTVEHGPVPNSTLMPAAGYALLRANSRDELVANVQKFMEVAGDGTCEIIQVFDEPPQPGR
jgi:hypothetical protein